MNLNEWLEDIQKTHPKDWDLGLDRVGEVGRRMDVLHPAKTCFLVAGTNGKGSTCEYLAQLAAAQGKSFGKATSPFLNRYNEQIVINGQLAEDDEIVGAFEAIRHAAGEISLSYFEYGALAAMFLFKRADVEIGIFEIGLGGRLDAMNIIDPDVSVITKIALDHQDWLGDDREAIGFEKAGVMRTEKPVVVLDEDAPQRLLDHARAISSELQLVNRDFSYTASEITIDKQSYRFSQTVLPIPSAVAAIIAYRAAGFVLTQAQVDKALQQGRLPGRFQIASRDPWVVLDVCHNPDAAEYLVKKLSELNVTRWHVVAGVYADKDQAGIFQHLAPTSASWHFADLSAPRGAPATDLSRVLSDSCGLTAKTYDKVSLALAGALKAVSPGEGVLVLGSFTTVAEAMTSKLIAV